MKRKGKIMYYRIDEDTARLAKEANSFREYVPGSATRAYREEVDAAQALAERHKKKVSPFYHEKIDRMVDGYSKRLAAWYNAKNRNNASCQSIMVSGGSNFPVGKKEKQMARDDSLIREYDEINEILKKMVSVGTGPVDLADPHAREILEFRLDQELEKQKTEKAVNAWYRKHGTIIGCPALPEDSAQRLQKQFEKVKSSYSVSDVPFPSYELSSVRGKIKRLRSRIEDLDRLQDAPAGERDIDFEGGHIVRNIEQNRLQIFFDEKPDDDLRGELKSHGFRWAPSQEAWQRQLTENAVAAAKKVLGL